MPAMLRYRPDADQLALAEELSAPLTALLPIARLHAHGHENDAAWRQLEELGLLTAGLPVDGGGSGLRAAEMALIAVTLGRTLAAPAVFATLAASPALAGGGIVTAALPGPGAVWIDEPAARLVLVRSAGGATLHAVPGGAELLDDGAWGVRLRHGVLGEEIAALGSGEFRLLRLLEAGALAGIAAAALDMAVDYAKVREQFGRAIGSFQAVKHHCADMAIAARAAGDMVAFAAVAEDDGREDAAEAIEAAFLVATRAAIGNAGTSIQVHGGIGFSAEADPHLLLKRAQLIAALGGGTEGAVARLTEG